MGFHHFLKQQLELLLYENQYHQKLSNELIEDIKGMIIELNGEIEKGYISDETEIQKHKELIMKNINKYKIITDSIKNMSLKY